MKFLIIYNSVFFVLNLYCAIMFDTRWVRLNAFIAGALMVVIIWSLVERKNDLPKM